MDFQRVFLRVAAACCTLLLASCEMPAPQAYQQPQQGYQQPQAGPFMLGIDVLASRGFDLIRGKRVGLITNQTSMTGRGERTRTVMQRALGPNLVALYAPEHGIDGTIGAGLHVSTRRDNVTGLTVYSLYGPTRKPTPAMLAPIDVLVFDLQDIGCRSYTYISTMIVAMEAAAECGKQFVVLDRPNPIGGWRVEGPPLEAKWKSFVGQIPVPYVHGMTAGELAMMAAGRGWMARVPRLDVVKMQGWTRGMTWQDTGLHWYQTSPNIPHATSPFYYVATGILGGATSVDIGIGTENPFGYAGGSGVNPQALYAYCQRLNTPGVSFSPYSKNGFGGVRLNISPRATADITALDVLLLGEINRQTGGKVIGRMSGSKLNLFNKVYGSESLYHDLRRGVPAMSIVSRWQGYNQSFRSQRQRFLLYP
ncbi:exo-beta-N-acetylmuramidase NamZ domain-containing protein [Prosthecobacter sp.]|uniref:exo-beta-N-acetylmuramidase NamZ family protein n=1 Tax=Prosthecobacter sp. TaxID=1965333 RepID=UPI003784366E